MPMVFQLWPRMANFHRLMFFLPFSLSLTKLSYAQPLHSCAFLIYYKFCWQLVFGVSALSFRQIIIIVIRRYFGRILNDIPIEKDNAKFFPLRKLTDRKQTITIARGVYPPCICISRSALFRLCFVLFCSIVNRSVWTHYSKIHLVVVASNYQQQHQHRRRRQRHEYTEVDYGNFYFDGNSEARSSLLFCFIFYAKFADIISIKA